MSMPPNIRIEGQDQAAKFCQEFNVVHNANEFILSMVEVIPQIEFIIDNNPRFQTKEMLHKITGRFAMSPATMKKLLGVIQKNIMEYEKKFGEIAINTPEGMH